MEAKGELTRLLLHAGSFDFEDHRIPFPEWPGEHKAATTFPFFAGTELSSRSQWPLPGRFLLLDNSSIFSLFLVFTSFLVKLGNMLCDLLTANYYYYADLKMIQNQINR